MKLGSRRTDPITGAKGYVTRFVGEMALCRADDGTMFRLPLDAKKRKAAARQRHYASEFHPQRCLIKVIGETTVFVGETIPSEHGLKAIIKDDDPIWHDCPVDEDEAIIEPIAAVRGRPKKGQREEVLAVGARK